MHFLRSALGKLAVPMPQINIGTAFSTAANAAFNTTLKPAFSPYANDLFFYHGAFIFEDVGVTAYKVRLVPMECAPPLCLPVVFISITAAVQWSCTKLRAYHILMKDLLHAALFLMTPTRDSLLSTG